MALEQKYSKEFDLLGAYESPNMLAALRRMSTDPMFELALARMRTHLKKLPPLSRAEAMDLLLAMLRQIREEVEDAEDDL